MRKKHLVSLTARPFANAFTQTSQRPGVQPGLWLRLATTPMMSQERSLRGRSSAILPLPDYDLNRSAGGSGLLLLRRDHQQNLPLANLQQSSLPCQRERINSCRCDQYDQ